MNLCAAGVGMRALTTMVVMIVMKTLGLGEDNAES